MSSETLAITVTVLAAIVVGTFGGWLTVKGLSPTKYTPANADKLLASGHPEVWNEARGLNPSWVPDLSDRSFRDASLPGVNLAGANLRGADFSHSDLSDADLTGADLTGACLRGTSLDGARLDHALLEDADLAEARLAGATFAGATLSPAQRDQLPIPDRQPGEHLSPKLILAHPEELDRISGQELEDFVARLFEGDGYSVTRAPRISLGYDFTAVKPGPGGGKVVHAVKVKRYRGKRPLGFSIVRALSAAKLAHDADQAILVTTSPLSPGAAEAVETMGGIRVIDRAGLLEWTLRASGLFNRAA